jgi:predicted transcriptional regulator
VETSPEVFKALSNPIRWNILRLLKQRSFCVNALTYRLSASQPAVSQHLKVLEHAGLQVHYCLIPERLDECIEMLRDLKSDDG